MNQTYVFLSDEETILSHKKAKIIFENGESFLYLFHSKKEFGIYQNEKVEKIDQYRLSAIEDGLFSLVYLHHGEMKNCLVNLRQHTVELTMSCKTNHDDQILIHKQGSFNFITESGEVDLTPFTNEEKAVDFWTRFFTKHDESAIDDYLAEPYLQHNPHVADGVKAFKDEFHLRFQSDMKESSTEVKRVATRGDLVFIHNLLKRNPQVRGHAGMDIFRFENGKIVEHWDVIQTIPDESKNDHPMF